MATTPEMIHVGISRFHAILAVIDEVIEKNSPDLEDQLVMSYAIGEMTYAAETLHAILGRCHSRHD